MTVVEILKNIIYRGLESLGRYYSSYGGFVVDNNDPDYCGRLKLKVPEIYGDDIMDYWAWPKGFYSGKGYGMQIIPQVKDMVWVEFEKGDPRRPIWSHGHPIKDEIPNDLQDVKKYWIITPGGISLVLNDTDNVITLEIKDGAKIELAKDKITLVSGLTVEINKDNISLGKDQSSTYKAVLGDIAKKEWEKERDRLTALIQAIQSSTTTPYDGGASMKASILAAMAPYQSPTLIGDYSNTLSDKNTLE